MARGFKPPKQKKREEFRATVTLPSTASHVLVIQKNTAVYDLLYFASLLTLSFKSLMGEECLRLEI